MRCIPLGILLIYLSAPLCARTQASTASTPSPSEAVPAYPETTDGLKSLIQDMLDALTSENTEKWSSLVSSLSIPDHGPWFAKTFGQDEGLRLESKYVEVLPQASDKLRQRFSYALDGQMNDVSVGVLQKPAANTGEKLDQAIFVAMLQPVTIYRAKGLGPVNTSVGAGPMGRFPAYLGDFVWVDGGFRYIDLEVFEALSTAPQPRIRQAGEITAGNLIYQVDPIYPVKARAERIQGTVILHAILGTNGAVKDVEAISGDPILIEAAMEAVKQWKYTPTRLKGKAVEVDTYITVNFQLRR